MLEFLQELRKVRGARSGGLGVLHADAGCPDSRPHPPLHAPKPLLQHVTVGIVGGSDLVKIQEQLGSNGAPRAGAARRAARKGVAAAAAAASAELPLRLLQASGLLPGMLRPPTPPGMGGAACLRSCGMLCMRARAGPGAPAFDSATAPGPCLPQPWRLTTTSSARTAWWRTRRASCWRCSR